ncbi:MAG TPA: GMC oxidoreductase, partial [Thermoanaerobaculia bacterium]
IHDDGLGKWIRDNAWGHHASCSCKIGRPDDPSAVVDSRFRVIGTKGLRIVDASVFPKIPGFFIVTPIYMISEKAADVITEDARA